MTERELKKCFDIYVSNIVQKFQIVDWEASKSEIKKSICEFSVENVLSNIRYELIKLNNLFEKELCLFEEKSNSEELIEKFIEHLQLPLKNYRKSLNDLLPYIGIDWKKFGIDCAKGFLKGYFLPGAAVWDLINLPSKWKQEDKEIDEAINNLEKNDECLSNLVVELLTNQFYYYEKIEKCYEEYRKERFKVWLTRGITILIIILIIFFVFIGFYSFKFF